LCGCGRPITLVRPDDKFAGPAFARQAALIEAGLGSADAPSVRGSLARLLDVRDVCCLYRRIKVSDQLRRRCLQIGSGIHLGGLAISSMRDHKIGGDVEIHNRAGKCDRPTFMTAAYNPARH